jgi:hypothetical protein
MKHCLIVEFLPHRSQLIPLVANCDDMLVDVIARLVDNGVHRLWIVDEQQKPTSVVSMTDICKVIRYHADASPRMQTTRSAFCTVFVSHDGKALGADGDTVNVCPMFGDVFATYTRTLQIITSSQVN